MLLTVEKQYCCDHGETFIQKKRKKITQCFAIADSLLFPDITNTCVFPLLLCKQEKNGRIQLQLLISHHTQTRTNSLSVSEMHTNHARIDHLGGILLAPSPSAHTRYHIFHVSIFIQSYCNGTAGTAAGSPLWARLLPEVSAMLSLQPSFEYK